MENAVRGVGKSSIIFQVIHFINLLKERKMHPRSSVDFGYKIFDIKMDLVHLILLFTYLIIIWGIEMRLICTLFCDKTASSLNVWSLVGWMRPVTVVTILLHSSPKNFYFPFYSFYILTELPYLRFKTCHCVMLIKLLEKHFWFSLSHFDVHITTHMIYMMKHKLSLKG